MEYFSYFIVSLFLALYEVVAKFILIANQVFPGVVRRLFELSMKATDITFNGSRPTDIEVLKPEKFFGSVAAYKDLGLFESYMNEEWTSKDLTGTFSKFVISDGFRYTIHPIHFLLTRLNRQTGNNIWKVARDHYDKGNDLYEAMLDGHMQYTCAYWRNAKNLNEAQIAKMDLIARKMYLKPGMRVLDLGCGFGTLACYLAKNYNVSVVGCNISKEQLNYGKNAAEGLDVEFRFCDYREMNEKFDRIISIGLTEHVGPNNYRSLIDVAHRCLNDEGLLLLHTIGCNHTSFPRTCAANDKYIFPNGQIPYYLEIGKAIEGHFIIEDWHNFGFDYHKTLASWRENFENALPKLRVNYDEKFLRLWRLYLCCAESLFLTRRYQLWQIVLSKDGLKEGYQSVR